mgnify:CR=1 FL=1
MSEAAETPGTTRQSDPATDRGATDLIGVALERTGSLVRNEVDLARAEVNENLKKAGVAVGFVVAALVFALTALNVLIGTLIAGLVELGVEETLAALIVGAALGIGAYALMKKGLNDMKLSSLAPTRTASSAKTDVHSVKEAVK